MLNLYYFICSDVSSRSNGHGPFAGRHGSRRHRQRRQGASSHAGGNQHQDSAIGFAHLRAGECKVCAELYKIKLIHKSHNFPNSDKACKAHSSGIEKASGPRGAVEEGLAVVRENVTHWYNVGQTQTHRLDDFYQTGKEHSRGMESIEHIIYTSRYKNVQATFKHFF